jgi:methylamine dehydrogenase light chain
MSKARTTFDRASERFVRGLAGYTSRRSFLSRLGAAVTASAALPLLPVARSEAAPPPPESDFERYSQSTDDTRCDYWKYCASSGVLCSCCGGDHHTCPPGTEPSPISWVGTSMHPETSKPYIIAYRDCCGKSACQADRNCTCDGEDGALPSYRAQLDNHVIWCFGSSTQVYHCSTAALVGPAN